MLMQTWLPYSDFWMTARCLDNRTLSIQRFEAWTLLVSLRYNDGYAPPKLANMWREHTPWLIAYGNAVCIEWERRHGETSELSRLFKDAVPTPLDYRELDYPPWLGYPLLHVSHRANLIKVNPDHYQPQWPGVPEGIPLVWPIPTSEGE